MHRDPLGGTMRSIALPLALALVTLGLAPLAAADHPTYPVVQTCGYLPKSSGECESYCIFGVWVRPDPSSSRREEICVVPNCACYPGLTIARPDAVDALLP